MGACRQTIHICAYRASRVNANGTPDVGEDSMIEKYDVIQLGLSFQIEEGAELRQKNGCDQVCLTYNGEDEVVGLDLNLELCDLDVELLELLTDSTLISDGGDSIGLMQRAVGTGARNGVIFEAWSKRWDTGSQDGTLPYWHWVFPRWKPRIGDFTLQNDTTIIPVSGPAEENSGAGNGPVNDWPVDIETLWGVFASDDLPDDDSCTYQSVSAS